MSSVWDTGDGSMHRLLATKDICLEGNNQSIGLDFLMVARLPEYPKKRSLIQFEELPRDTSIKWAKMYLYYWRAHKASWLEVHQAPYFSHTLHVHQVKKEWDESQTTSLYRLTGVAWKRPYLALDGTDAAPSSIGSAIIFNSRPRGYVEFDVTEAVRNWHSGEPNYGLLILAADEYAEGRDLRFYSRRHGDPQTQPMLHVLCD